MGFEKSKILQEDYDWVWERVEHKADLKGSVFLITGIAGFLGFNFVNSLCHLAKDGINPAHIIGLDNFILGKPKWIEALMKDFPFLKIYDFNIGKDELALIPKAAEADYVLHLASIASPSFYRKYPIETIDANVNGLRKLLDFYKDKSIKSLVFFSSSEIYGDPLHGFIPTPESYRGNVPCIGPRACYDEAKRFGETLCYFFNQVFEMPIKIVRPFNNYGPGMPVTDKRVVADFAQAILKNEDLIMYSDGSPKRTYCYISDALTGYFKALLHNPFDVFNIGIDKPEISVRDLAQIYKTWGEKICNYQGRIIERTSADKDYLVDNPQRRCPDISNAKKILQYRPAVEVAEGVSRYLAFLKEVRE
jgi:UDP-glucuronate decarboxylase